MPQSEVQRPPSESRFHSGVGRTVSETPPRSAGKPKLLDQIRIAARTRHLSPRTEQAYVQWIRRFILFHDKRHPLKMGEAEAAKFLSSLATDSM